MTRREMREHCFKILFGLDFFPTEETAGQVEQYFESPEEDDTNQDGQSEIIHQVEMKEDERAFLTDRVEGIAARIPELDIQINEVAQGWKTRRMGKVDLTILRQALYEMKYDSEVPEKVAINEAVDLAKKFGGKDSPAFINGVLAKLVSAE
ncbi:MAG: transcription antitermination factor NusB [Lachnospiraceae bacterium]|nr:transcription antitermination factor NusB [Lachnospiraceae bacterium]